VAPRALLWFRWGAVVTWLTGAAALETMGVGIVNAFTLAPEARIIGIGWLGTIMLFNVWVLIWPNRRRSSVSCRPVRKKLPGPRRSP
jgi:uncharacterized membrane protein